MILLNNHLKQIYKAELIKIIDGDTLDFKVFFGLGFFCNARIRLINIDAPEIFHVKKTDLEFLKGNIAKLDVKNWFYDSLPPYFINAEHRDLYGRWLGEVWKNVNEQSLNDYLIGRYYKSSYKTWKHQEPLLDS